MSCPCEGTWKYPCMPCYQRLLQETATEREAPPSPAELESRLAKCGVPPQLLADLRAPLTATPALKAARQFTQAQVGEARCLFLLGPVGRGKSVAAAWVVRERLKAKASDWNERASGTALLPAQFISAGQLTRLSSYDKLDTEWLAELKRVGLLVVDDAGDEGSAVGLIEFASVLLARFAKKLRTVVTSNLRKDAFAQRYGAAILDRAEQAGIVAELPGESMRRKGLRAVAS